jgi:hypothetical protein
MTFFAAKMFDGVLLSSPKSLNAIRTVIHVPNTKTTESLRSMAQEKTVNGLAVSQKTSTPSTHVSSSPPVSGVLPRFRSGFGNIHPLIDELRDFEDFDNEEVARLREFISTTPSCETLATDTFQ